LLPDTSLNTCKSRDLSTSPLLPLQHVGLLPSRHLFVGDGEGVTRDGGLGQVLVVDNDLADLGAAESNSLAVGSSGHTGELDSRGEGRKGDGRAAVTAALLEVLDDELGAGLAEGAGSLAGELLGDSLAGRQVLEGGRSAGLGGRLNGHGDRVTLGDVDAGKVLCRISISHLFILIKSRLRTKSLTSIQGVPLIPGIIGSVTVPVEASLENGSVAGSTVNTNPSRASSAGATAAKWDVGSGRGGSEAGALEDSTTPVGLNSSMLNSNQLAGCRASTACLPARGAAGSNTVGRHSSQGGLGAYERGQEGGGGELHLVEGTKTRVPIVEQGKLSRRLEDSF
jgi:hypothetical protein